MKLRSMLFVPGDRPERFAKAAGSGADAVIYDFEDAVAFSRKAFARDSVRAALQEPNKNNIRVVRVNPQSGEHLEADLDALRLTPPDMIMLPKAEGSASILACHAKLHERGLGHVPILPIVTETPTSVFMLGSYREVRSHLAAMTWGAEDLPSAIGATTSREADGQYTTPYAMVRSLTLFAAASAGIPAIDTVFPAFKNEAGLRTYATIAARDGFSGILAIHPAQISIIHQAFVPSPEAVEFAKRIVSAFESAPEAGVLEVDGRMVDLPHAKQAMRLLERARWT